MEDADTFSGHLVYLIVLWHFGIFCGHLVYYPHFGILSHEKSGNLGSKSKSGMEGSSPQPEMRAAVLANNEEEKLAFGVN
jgi:hypothetical protein